MNQKKRTSPWIIAIALMVLAVFVGGGMSLGKLRASAADSFTEKDQWGYDMAYDYQEIIAGCKNLLTVMGRHEGEAASHIGKVRTLAESMEKASTVDDRLAKVTEASQLMLELKDVAKDWNMGDEDQVFLQGLIRQVESHTLTMADGPYSLRAAAFNNAIGAFPASVIAGVLRIKPLPIFE